IQIEEYEQVTMEDEDNEEEEWRKKTMTAMRIMEALLEVGKKSRKPRDVRDQSFSAILLRLRVMMKTEEEEEDDEDECRVNEGFGFERYADLELLFIVISTCPIVCVEKNDKPGSF
ncbi:hypothetical protein Tsubulata_049214, partial [Turnera subulata]